MEHTERLLKIVNLLRNRRTVITAQVLAEKLGVSVRTIYRDIQKLSVAGIPIDGEAGVGYRILRRFELPPLMFDAEEVEALVLGVKMVRAWSDEQMASSANSALNKIVGVLPPELKELEDMMALDVPKFSEAERRNPHAPQVRDAIKHQRVLGITYLSLKNERSSRDIWPLGLYFWGHVWTLLSWCCLRNSYRVFRLDRIESLTVSSELFTSSPTCSLEHYLEGVKKSRDEQACDHHFDSFK